MGRPANPLLFFATRSQQAHAQRMDSYMFIFWNYKVWKFNLILAAWNLKRTVSHHRISIRLCRVTWCHDISLIRTIFSLKGGKWYSIAFFAMANVCILNLLINPENVLVSLVSVYVFWQIKFVIRSLTGSALDWDFRIMMYWNWNFHGKGLFFEYYWLNWTRKNGKGWQCATRKKG